MDPQAYLSRIGLRPTGAPDLETLAAIVTAHTNTIAFENLDPLRGAPVRLDPESLRRKLVEAGRGGYCFEHNLALLGALRALGYQASGHIARVRWNVPPEVVTPRSHMVIRVELDGPWIVDVGFGGQTLTAPLRLEPGLVQHTPHEPWRLLLQDHGTWEMQTELAGEWRPVYRFDLQEQHPIDFEVANWWTSSHPSSLFRSTLIAARVDGERRLALRNAELAVHGPGGTQRQRLDSVEAVVGTLRDQFHLAVPDDPALGEAIGRVIAT